MFVQNRASDNVSLHKTLEVVLEDPGVGQKQSLITPMKATKSVMNIHTLLGSNMTDGKSNMHSSLFTDSNKFSDGE